MRENLAQQCFLTVRTTDETGRGLIGPACLLYYKREKEQNGESEHSNSLRWTGTVMCYHYVKVNDDRGGFL